ncbi:MAG: aldehyde dehydrogenase family protein [Gammaproteobacteria bacterium]|nr:aldehyde dehydrogenase family protein [Gammaproteobacteria bacterium]MYG65856.1 aldehyde dehydrogenase family protein [Gammaproteobacteria bacterium]MYH91139.1 aldehyde dehydrogenase family protein [Gammaproteobacteria bacterium]
MAEPASAPRDEQETAVIEPLIRRARTAMAGISGVDQARIDELVTAVAWSLYKPENARRLAEMAVQDTGIGNVADKVVKNQRKTFGTLRDLMRARTVGIIEDDPARGLVRYAKPVGVVAAVTPSTNPAATPVNKTMMALKGANAIIIAPSPAGWTTTHEAVELMRGALARLDAPADLVQVLPAPVSREITRAVMRAADLVVTTGSQNNVRSAYSSGTPAIGVGAGNVPVVIDDTADLDDAAEKILASKTFDNATSCSSENSLIILDGVYEEAMDALVRVGAYRTAPTERELIEKALWRDGKLNRELIARDADVFARGVDLAPEAEKCRFFLVEEPEFDPGSPFADEKLSLVLTVYRARDFDHAVTLVRDVLDVQGKGHSCGIHTRTPGHPERLAETMDVVRVLINQAHTFGNGGSFNNALNFTLSMGCGTWGGNSISENLNYRHFINITHLVTAVGEDRPTEEELFGAHFARYGRD